LITDGIRRAARHGDDIAARYVAGLSARKRKSAGRK
jgi:hypothetical protein